MFEHFKIFAKTWHALLHLTRIVTHPTHTVTSFSSLARQIVCHGVNRLSCQCEACLSSVVSSCFNILKVTHRQARRHTHLLFTAPRVKGRPNYTVVHQTPTSFILLQFQVVCFATSSKFCSTRSKLIAARGRIFATRSKTDNGYETRR